MNSRNSRRSKSSHGRWKAAGLTSGAIALTIATALGTAQPAAADEWSGNPANWVGGKIFQEWDELGKPWAATGPERPAARGGRLQDFGANSIYWHPLVSAGHANQIGGAIRTKYGQRNWENGNLMYPTTREGAAQGGRFNHFEGGSIYWSQSTGANQIGGLIRDKWAAMDWERGTLGFPTTDEYVAGSGQGAGNHFQGGDIYWSPSTGAHPVWGAIRDQWVAAGWENGQYGFPKSDEYDHKGGKKQDFQNGSIEWGVRHGSVTGHWYGYEIKVDKFLVDKINNGGIAGVAAIGGLAVLLGLAPEHAAAAVVAIGAGITAASAICADGNGDVTFYMQTLIVPPVVVCNPFAGRSAGIAGPDEGIPILTGDEQLPPRPDGAIDPFDPESTSSMTPAPTSSVNPSGPASPAPEPGVVGPSSPEVAPPAASTGAPVPPTVSELPNSSTAPSSTSSPASPSTTTTTKRPSLTPAN